MFPSGVVLLSAVFLIASVPSPSLAAVTAPKNFGENQGPLPTSIRGDRMEYLQDQDRYVADGHVVLERGTLWLSADHLTYDNRTGDVEATGQVMMLDGAQRIVMDRLTFNVGTQSGVMYHADLLNPELSYRLMAGRIERRPDGSLFAEAAAFTTCDIVCERGTPSWQFLARRLDARLGESLVARGVTLKVKGLSVAYLPWFVYPLQPRQSGLLIPTIGFNSSEGFKYRQPLYWVLGRSQDATVSLDLRSRLGIGVDTEYRYRLSETTAGLADVDYFYKWDTGENFLTYHAEQRQRPADRLQVQWDLNMVNRKDFFTQLSDSTIERSQVGLDSVASVSYRLDEQLVYVTARYSQNLIGSTASSIQRLPELGYRLVDYRLGVLPLYAGVTASSIYFYQETGPRVFRTDLFPTVTMHLDAVPGVIVTPTAGFRETYYVGHNAVPNGSEGRELVYLALRAESQWVRQFSSLAHLVEPAVLYEYVHQLRDVVVPQFDAVDAVSDKRQLTMIMTTRLRRTTSFPAVAAATPQSPKSFPPMAGDLLWVKITDSYSLQQSVTEPFSDLRIQAQIRPAPFLALVTESFVNLYGRGVTVWNGDLRTTIGDLAVLTFGEQYTRRGPVPQRGDLFSPEVIEPVDPVAGTERISALRWGGQVALPWRLTLATRSLYDLDHQQFTEMSYGVRLRGSCNECWVLTLVYQQFPEKRQVMFLISLPGLSGSESSAMKTLFQQ